jgi:hypothetical protein
MMNRKETSTALVVVGLTLLATITMISPTQASALGHWNVDEDFTPHIHTQIAQDAQDSSGTSDNTDEEIEDSSDEEEEDSITAANTGEDSTDNSNEEDSTSSGYEAFQDCLAEIKESPTEEQVQDCVDSSYSGMDNNEDTPVESTDGGEENGEDVSTDDTEVEEEEE